MSDVTMTTEMKVPICLLSSTYLCTTSPSRMLSKWPWISRCGDYWQQVELCT